MNNNTTGFISIDVIANKIYKNPLLKDLNFEDIIDYTLSVIKIAKVPGIYHEESCFKDVNNHMIVIPKNALNIKTVDYCYGKNLIPMIMSSDSLSNHIQKIDSQNNMNKLHNGYSQKTYSINNNIIKTSFPEGTIFITFDTIRVDENDIPMIPNSEALLRAIEAYIKVQVYSVLADLQKVSERALNRAEQDYLWYIGKTQTEYQGFKNEDDMENFINGWKRQFLSQRDHDTRYSQESRKENIKRL